MTAGGQLFTNNAVSLLDADISASDLSIQVQAGYGALFPQPVAGYEFFLVTLENAAAPLNREIVKIASRAGDVLTVAPGGRGWEGTTAQAWTVGNVIVDHRVTAGTLRDLQGHFGDPTFGITVPVTTTQTANTLNITGQNQTCKWIVTIKTADSRIAMTEVIAVYKPAPDAPIFTEYAKVGDKIKYSISVIGTPTDMILEVTNTDTSLFTSVDVIRLQHFT